MARTLPGQRGFRGVAPDVPKQDEDWREAFDIVNRTGGKFTVGFDPAGDESTLIYALVFQGVRVEDVEPRLIELAQSLNMGLYIITTEVRE